MTMLSRCCAKQPRAFNTEPRVILYRGVSRRATGRMLRPGDMSADCSADTLLVVPGLVPILVLCLPQLISWMNAEYDKTRQSTTSGRDDLTIDLDPKRSGGWMQNTGYRMGRKFTCTMLSIVASGCRCNLSQHLDGLSLR